MWVASWLHSVHATVDGAQSRCGPIDPLRNTEVRAVVRSLSSQQLCFLALLDTLFDSGSPARLTVAPQRKGNHTDAHSKVFVTSRQVVDRARAYVAPRET